MKKKELIELYYAVEEAHEERKRLGDFDANSKYMMILLDGLQKAIAHAIEQDGKFLLAPKPIKGKRENKK
jgi:hypothetical protein